MLKVNYPDLAEKIDSEPLFDENQTSQKLSIDGEPQTQPQPQYTFGGEDPNSTDGKGEIKEAKY